MNVNPLASTTENKENATNTNETNSGVNPLPNGLPLSIFCQSKEADPVKERALFEKWRQRNVEEIKNKKVQFDRFLNFLKEQLSEERYKKIESRLNKIGETILSSSYVNSLKIVQLQQNFLFTQLECAIILAGGLSKEEISNLQLLSNEETELNCTKKILNLALLYQGFIKSLHSIEDVEKKASFIKFVIKQLCKKSKYKKAVMLFHLALLRNELAFCYIPAYSTLLKKLQLLENRREFLLLITKALECIPFFIENQFANYEIPNPLSNQICEVLLDISKSNACFEEVTTCIHSCSDLSIKTKFYALSAVQLSNTNFMAALHLIAKIGKISVAHTVIETIFNHITEEKINDALNFLTTSPYILPNIENLMRFQIVSNLCSRGEIEKAKKIAHDSNQENLNQSLIFAPIILHLLTADEGLKTEKLNEVIALLPYLNKKSKLEISDLKQKSQELATDLNNRFENEKADKLYANIALLLSKNERIKEGLSVIKKIKNEELQNNTISLAIHLSRETRSIFSSSQNENLISKNLFLFLDKYLPSKERENHLLRNFFCIEFIKNLCSKNKVDQALIVLDHELKCCTRPKVENHLLKDSCYIEIIKNACEKIQINLALKILNEDLKSPEKQKIAFNIIMQKVSEENCFIELFELAKNLSENKNTAHLQKKIYSKLALHYANYFSDDYHLQSVLNGITSPLELNIFQTSILELINRESNDQALTAIQAFKIPNERNQDRKTAMLKEVALGFIRQENFESAIELIVSMEEGDQWQVIEKAFLMLMQPEKYSDADSFITMISMILPELTNQMLLTSVNNYCSRFNFKGACLSAMMISSKDIKEDATNTIKRYLIEQLNKEELEKLAPIGNAFLRMTILGYHEQARELIKMIPEKFSIEKHRLFLSIIETFCQNNAIDHAYQTMLMLEDLEKQMQVTKEILPILINKSFYIQACSFINVVATELQINNKELFLSTLANYCKNHYFYYAWRMIDVMENKDGKQEAQEIIKEALFSLLCTDHLDKLELIKTAFFGLVDEEHYIQASSFINMVPAHKFPEEIKQIYISTFDELWFEEKAEKAIAVIFSVGSNNKEQQLQLAYEIYLHLLSIDSDVAAIFVYTLLQYNHINEQEMIYFFRS